VDHIDINDLDSLPSTSDVDSNVDVLTISPYDINNGDSGAMYPDYHGHRRPIHTPTIHHDNIKASVSMSASGSDNNEVSLVDRTMFARRLDREFAGLHGGVSTGAYIPGRKLGSPNRGGTATRRQGRDVQLLHDELAFHQSLDRLSQKDKAFAELVERAAARAEQWQMSQWDRFNDNYQRIMSPTQRQHALLEMALDAEREAEQELERLL
jgi:hypothetical protein